MSFIVFNLKSLLLSSKQTISNNTDLTTKIRKLVSVQFLYYLLGPADNKKGYFLKNAADLGD